MKPGEWGTRDGKPTIIWYRPGIAARGEPSVVQEVRTYASEGERFDAYQGMDTKDANQVYEVGSDATYWYSKVIRDGERFNVQVYDADGDRRADREDSFPDQPSAVSFADKAVQRFADRKPKAGDDLRKFDYLLLGRLKQDCDYFLGAGGRATKHLWAGNVNAQIQKMKDLYDILPAKPKWITPEQISEYEKNMALGITLQIVSTEHGFNDFDVVGHQEVHRVTVGRDIKKGDLFNVYGTDGAKRGATWDGSLVPSLASVLGVGADAIQVLPEKVVEKAVDENEAPQHLNAEVISALLAEQDETCNPERIGYYDSLDLLVQQVRSSKHWTQGEVFAFGDANGEFLVMKQIAPSSCEMLAITNQGYMDVLTAYRFTQEELVEAVRAHMGQREAKLSDPQLPAEQKPSESLADEWHAKAGKGQEVGRIVALSETEVVQDAGRQRYVVWDRKGLQDQDLAVGEQVTITNRGAVERHSLDKAKDLGR